MLKKLSILILGMGLTLSLSACASKDLAAQTVEGYYQAVIAGDVDRSTSLSCADWEAFAQTEAASFQSAEASLDALNCEKTDTDGEVTVVSCTGQIIMSYNGEAQSLDLSVRRYQVVEQGGDWLFCGYR